ncbi:MAG TPA: DUF5684 domain-containing protein [Chitinophagales bacterium]|nr:DUF5684 domain-containing protein [Chitinophagales bacterium]
MENNDAGAIAAIIAGLGIFLVFFFAFILFFIVCHWKIFTKAGQEGWKSIIPLYNLYIQLQIAKQPTIWLLYFMIPFVNIYFGIKHVHGLSKAFGKDVGFTVGLILLPIVFYPILAFGDAKYVYNENNSLINEIQEIK